MFSIFNLPKLIKGYVNSYSLSLPNILRSRVGVYSKNNENLYNYRIIRGVMDAPEIIKYFYRNVIEIYPIDIEFVFNRFGNNHLNFYPECPEVCDITIYNRSIDDLDGEWYCKSISEDDLLTSTFFHEFGHYIDFSCELGKRSSRPSWEIFNNDMMLECLNNIYSLIEKECPTENVHFVKENYIITGILSTVLSLGDKEINTIKYHPKGYYDKETRRNEEIFAEFISLYSKKKYDDISKLKNHYGCELLVNSFINYINEISEKYGIPKDKKLNDILETEIMVA